MDSLIAAWISVALPVDVELLSTVRNSNLNILIALVVCLIPALLFCYHSFQLMWVEDPVQYFAGIGCFHLVSENPY